MKTIISALLIILLVASVSAETSADNIWQEIDDSVTMQDRDPAETQQPWVQPQKYRLFSLNTNALEQVLSQAPQEQPDLPAARQVLSVSISLPDPDGIYKHFEFVESPVMAPELAAKFPEIKTYAGYSLDGSQDYVRFDWTPAGFHAQVFSKKGTWYIDPYIRGESYASYYKKNYYHPDKPFECHVGDTGERTFSLRLPFTAARSGDTLHTYRLAVACTGEYGQFHGGTKNLVMAAITTTINRVTGIFQQELAARIELVANNNSIVYTDPATDPFTGNDNADTLIGESQIEIDKTIGTANYDIGHTFSTGAGGLACVGVVCQSVGLCGGKASGVTGSSNPTGDPFDVDFVAHEIGHQFGGNHSFNGINDACSGGSRNASTAYEPGSGSTIMGYAGICGADDLQSNSDPIFHSASHDEARDNIDNNFYTGSTCGTTAALSNAIPSANAGSDHTIPAKTPFMLTGSATDSDVSDVLTYLWEERDLGPAAALDVPDDGTIPLFRVYTNITDPVRYFPKLDKLVNNTSDNAEKLPQLGRVMTFRLAVRDGKGGVHSDDMQVTVEGNAGPFQVTAPNGSEILNRSTTVTWNVAGTASAPISTANVDILLSTDGGMTYNTGSPLAASTPNDGSEQVTLPSGCYRKARIMVKGGNNIFFDISDRNFAIQQDNCAPVLTWQLLLLGD